jgi:16S rRNA processing protein RimM
MGYVKIYSDRSFFETGKGSVKMNVENLIEAGKIVSVFGIKGEVKVQPWCDSPEFLCEFDRLYYKSGTEVEIERSRPQKNIVVMKIKGVDTVEDAQKIRNRVLYLDREDVELDEGCYFIRDLIGLKVADSDSGRVYGTITDVSETGANDVYHIKGEDGKMYYIPAIPSVIDRTDIEGGVMEITPLDGLFEGMEEIR